MADRLVGQYTVTILGVVHWIEVYEGLDGPRLELSIGGMPYGTPSGVVARILNNCISQVRRILKGSAILRGDFLIEVGNKVTPTLLRQVEIS